MKHFSAFYNKKSVVVTGGAGFIGSHLVEALVEYGAKVTVLDNLSAGQLGNLKAVLDKITFIKGSIQDPKACQLAFHGAHALFHLAAVLPTKKPGSLSPQKCHDINSKGTHIVLEAARAANIKRFVFTSSSLVYGSYKGICDEAQDCHPTSVYGYSKLHGELFCKEYANLFGMHIVCLRLFNVFGLRQRPLSPYAIAWQNAFSNWQKEPNKQLYEHVLNVDDAVIASLQACLLPKQRAQGHLYNIAHNAAKKPKVWHDELSQLLATISSSTNQTEHAPVNNSFAAANCARYHKVIQEMQP
jgi:nucleoside-diphosphate-sugar epimerase